MSAKPFWAFVANLAEAEFNERRDCLAGIADEYRVAVQVRITTTKGRA